MHQAIIRKRAMIQNLQDIKAQEQNLRSQLIVVYSNSTHSVLELSKRIGIPYTTFRGFMLGANIYPKNLFKIQKWLDSTK